MDYNINIDGAKELGMFFIFSKYWLPVIVGGIILIIGAVILYKIINYLINYRDRGIDRNLWP